MRASRAEITIEEILTKADLNFKMEYVFPDLKSSSGRPLRFDFVVFDDDGIIDFPVAADVITITPQRVAAIAFLIPKNFLMIISSPIKL